MSSTLSIEIKEKSKSGDVWFEGVVTLPGVQPTRLVRKSDGEYRFGSTNAVRTCARNFAKQLGCDADVQLAEKKVSKKAVATAS